MKPKGGLKHARWDGTSNDQTDPFEQTLKIKCRPNGIIHTPHNAM